MKLSALLATLLTALFLSGCGEKASEAPAVEAPVAAAPVETVPVAAPAPTAGGYTPTADELVLGITRTKEEQDKINAEAMAGTPMPIIPGEAPPVAAEVAADAEAAVPTPAETK